LVLLVNSLVVAVVTVAVAAYVVHKVGRHLRSVLFLVVVARWLTGAHPDGKPRTDAGWFRWGRKPLTRTGHALHHWHRPRSHRLFIHCALTGAPVAVIWGLVAYRAAAESVLGCALAGVLAWVAWRIVARRRHRNWLMPLHQAAHDRVGIARAAAASSWIKLELDRDKAVTGVTLSLPEGWPPEPKDREWLEGVAALKLGIEAAEPSWRHAGPKPQLVLRRAVPMPGKIDYDRVADAVARAHSNEFVVGIGRKDSVVKASLSLDSPHFAINMGTGAGKSNLAAFYLVQHLTRGGIAMVLDAKQFSHPWLFKDETGEYAQLPNVSYCWTTEQIHDAMVWLGDEVARRNAVARRAVTASGSLRGNVGPRILIIAEELNFGMTDLKQYWSEIREPDDLPRSPALKGLAKVAFAGRAVKMNMVLIGQMLTAEVTGSRDSSVKENVGVTAMARYGLPGWRTAVGANIPMPPVPSVLGRVQLVTTGPKVSETQTPLGDLLMYRQMVLASDMALCPAGMPGAVTATGRELACTPPDLSLSQVTRPPEQRPGGRVTLAEAVEKGVVKRRSKTALMRASHRPGFPPERGLNGLARLYDAMDLAEFDSGRRWETAGKEAINA
jgi:hypothetical protein